MFPIYSPYSVPKALSTASNDLKPRTSTLGLNPSDHVNLNDNLSFRLSEFTRITESTMTFACSPNIHHRNLTSQFLKIHNQSQFQNNFLNIFLPKNFFYPSFVRFTYQYQIGIRYLSINEMIKPSVTIHPYGPDNFTFWFESL